MPKIQVLAIRLLNEIINITFGYLTKKTMTFALNPSQQTSY